MHTIYIISGFRADFPLDDDISGSFISNDNKCYAQNGGNKSAWAIARCCNLSQFQTSCHTNYTQLSIIVYQQCSANQHLMGW